MVEAAATGEFFVDAEKLFNETNFDTFTKSVDTPDQKIYKKHADGIITCRIEAIFEGYDPVKAFNTVADINIRKTFGPALRKGTIIEENKDTLEYVIYYRQEKPNMFMSARDNLYRSKVK